MKNLYLGMLEKKEQLTLDWQCQASLGLQSPGSIAEAPCSDDIQHEGQR